MHIFYSVCHKVADVIVASYFFQNEPFVGSVFTQTLFYPRVDTEEALQLTACSIHFVALMYCA